MEHTNQQIANIIEKFIPLSLAEDYDNVGLLVGERERKVTGVLLCLDITTEVIDEAVNLGASLIISHHPIWFKKRSTLLGDDFASKVILSAIRNNISLYAAHTNFDNTKEGVSLSIARALSLKNLEILRAHGEATTIGSGMVGELDIELSQLEFISFLSQMFHVPSIRYCALADKEKKVKRIAFCGGAGSFLLGDAMKKEVDAFVTSDISYHNFFETHGKILLADIGHYESEQYCVKVLYEYLQKKCSDFPVAMTQINTNPVSYF